MHSTSDAGASRRDAIVIGGGLSGLIAAGLLSRLGLDTLVLERSPEAGGGVQSIRDGLGNVFDKGYHTLDYGRSEVTTRYFQRLLAGNFRRMELKRGLVLGDSVLPYNAPFEQWPAGLRDLFDGPPGMDDLGSMPDRDALAGVYGRRFADYAFDEILASYPSKAWALRNGGRPEEHIDYVYPWFFPRARRGSARIGETYAYHDRMREVRQEILYPSSGGFGAFVRAIEEDVDGRFCEIRTGVKDVRIAFAPGTRRVEGVQAGDEFVQANHYFWCAPLPALLKTFGIGIEAGPPQKIVIGNFAFSGPLPVDYHEILVGSRAHLINRICYPGLLSGGPNTLLQTEFYFPDGEFPADPAFWEDSWADSIRRLGLAGDTKPAGFQLFSEFRGVVAAKRYQTLSEETFEAFGRVETDLVVPFYNLGPENINRLVPGVLKGVVDALAAGGGKGGV
jgi:phytoene dehydrogenase-like protein